MIGNESYTITNEVTQGHPEARDKFEKQAPFVIDSVAFEMHHGTLGVDPR